MEIKVYGPGCRNCTKLEQEVRNVLLDLGIAANVEKVEDLAKIADAGILMTPGLKINDKVKVYGRVPKKEEIKKLIEEEI